MGQNANILEEQLSPTSSKNVLEMLTISLICILLVWYAQYHWKKRKLYHAAAKSSGPFAFPLIGNALDFLGSNEAVFNKFLKLTREYESPIRAWLGPRLFLGVWKPSQLEIILNSPHALEKEKLYKFAVPALGDGLFTASVPKWRRHRKIILPTFNQKNLDGFVEIFANQTQVLVEQLKKESGKGIFDIFSYVSRCTLDIFCETAMGVTVNAQTTESEYIHWANKAMGIVFVRMSNIFYHPDFIFNRSSIGKELQEVTKKMRDFTSTVVVDKRKAYQKQLKEDKERPEAALQEEKRKIKTFLHQLLEKSEEGGNLTDEELREEVDTFMFGGSDTSASTACFIFLALGIMPDIQTRVYQEIIDVLGPDRPVECEDLGKFHYLERVIKEALRLFPVAALALRTIEQDIELDDFTIPAGCSVIMSIISVQRDPTLWPDCLKFDPDRYLPEEVAKRHPYSWIPFSGGLRSCPGPRYAMMSVKSLVAMVIRKYQVFTDYESIEDIKLTSVVVLKPARGYRLSVKLRE